MCTYSLNILAHTFFYYTNAILMRLEYRNNSPTTFTFSTFLPGLMDFRATMRYCHVTGGSWNLNKVSNMKNHRRFCNHYFFINLQYIFIHPIIVFCRQYFLSSRKLFDNIIFSENHTHSSKSQSGDKGFHILH